MPFKVKHQMQDRKAFAIQAASPEKTLVVQE
jgi:hypothetical protein